MEIPLHIIVVDKVLILPIDLDVSERKTGIRTTVYYNLIYFRSILARIIVDRFFLLLFEKRAPSKTTRFYPINHFGFDVAIKYNPLILIPVTTKPYLTSI